MNQVENFILNNKFDDFKDVLLLDEFNENKIKDLLNPLIDDYGLIIIYILLQLAFDRNESFWYNLVGYYLSFSLSHVNGAERMSLAMFKKSFEIEPSDVTLNAILDFRQPPEVVLTDFEYNYYSKLLKK